MNAVQRQAIIMGGCHVAGYGLADAAPFWTETVRQWGAQKIDCRANVSVNRALAIVRELTPLPPGTLVILQLGHYDLHAQTSPLNPVGRQFVPSPKGVTLSQNTSSQSVDGGQTTTLSKRWSTFLRGITLLTLDQLLVSKEIIDNNIKGIAAQFETLIEQLERADADKIIVLSNFPTCNPRANHYRLIFSKIMKNITTNRGHVYVDLDWKKFSIGFRHFSILRRENALDSDHINARGHSVISQIVAEQSI